MVVTGGPKAVNDAGAAQSKGNAGEEEDIPFEDIPERGNDGAQSSGTAESSQQEPHVGERGKESSKERTSPGPGSTEPTTVREDLGTLAEEARRLWSSFEARVVAPGIQSSPEVARPLGAAGREVAAALRSAIRGSEQTWRDSG